MQKVGCQTRGIYTKKNESTYSRQPAAINLKILIHFFLWSSFFGGRWRIRTADPLLVRQMLWTSWAKRPLFALKNVQTFKFCLCCFSFAVAKVRTFFNPANIWGIFFRCFFGMYAVIFFKNLILIGLWGLSFFIYRNVEWTVFYFLLGGHSFLEYFI